MNAVIIHSVNFQNTPHKIQQRLITRKISTTVFFLTTHEQLEVLEGKLCKGKILIVSGNPNAKVGI